MSALIARASVLGLAERLREKAARIEVKFGHSENAAERASSKLVSAAIESDAEELEGLVGK